ncbi:hypothetical protein [uncultured Roseobacter sp.]|uniref:hypothetical protein n=1 Tax=uncultured Roseobacter sp. TaxID=114847 RepID=UPI002635EC70|nr:hypothetical protein [uncultured Roseobacter sp.]
MSVDHRAVIAAHNNADLYEAMFSAHGLAYQRLPFAFVGKDRPLPFYSNLTVLSPDHETEIIQEIKDMAAQFEGVVGLKDSFCHLDLAAHGFDTLFGASWIWRDAGVRTVASHWQPIETQADLALWEEGWKKNGSATERRMFTADLLHRDDMFFFGLKTGGEIAAGCIANRSENCIGLSNVFARAASSAVFSQATAAVAAIAPGLPIVGYESGVDLEHAGSAGFDTVGDLRILVAKNAAF